MKAEKIFAGKAGEIFFPGGKPTVNLYFWLKTGPNHQYSDLEGEKLLYKLLKLVLDDRVPFQKMGGGIAFFGDFRLKKKSTFFFFDVQIKLIIQAQTINIVTWRPKNWYINL